MKIITLVEDTKGMEGCGYEHGLSLYIETKNHKLLMDCGTTDMFLKNAEVLGVDLSQVDNVFLSHGHYDHSGGIIPFSKCNREAKIYLQKSAGEAYYHVTEEMEKYAGIDTAILDLPQTILLEGDKKIDALNQENSTAPIGDSLTHIFNQKQKRAFHIEKITVWEVAFGHSSSDKAKERGISAVITGGKGRGVVGIKSQKRKGKGTKNQKEQQLFQYLCGYIRFHNRNSP